MTCSESYSYTVRQITNNQCYPHPQCTVYCLSVSSYIQCICLARLSLNNMVLTMNLVITQRHENLYVGSDCSKLNKKLLVAIYWYNESIRRLRKEIDAPTMDRIQPTIAIKHACSFQSYSLSVSETQ